MEAEAKALAEIQALVSRLAKQKTVNEAAAAALQERAKKKKEEARRESVAMEREKRQQKRDTARANRQVSSPTRSCHAYFRFWLTHASN
jgi:hypothetical protein